MPIPLAENAMNQISFEVASFLKLLEPQRYTGFDRKQVRTPKKKVPIQTGSIQSTESNSQQQPCNVILDLQNLNPLVVPTETVKFDKVVIQQESKLEPSDAAKERVVEKRKQYAEKYLSYDPGKPVSKRITITPVPKIKTTVDTATLRPFRGGSNLTIERKRIHIVTAEDLEQFPKIKRAAMKKRSQWLTLEQVHRFLDNQHLDSDKAMLARKVFIIFSFVKGLKFCEIRGLKMEDLTVCEDGIYVSYDRVEKSGCTTRVKMLVGKKEPFDYAKILARYFDAMFEDTACTTGYLLKIPKYGKFAKNLRMGKNTMFSVGVEIAKHLKLEDPNAYGVYSPDPVRREVTVLSQNRTIAESVIVQDSLNTKTSDLTAPEEPYQQASQQVVATNTFTFNNTQYVTFQYQDEAPKAPISVVGVKDGDKVAEYLYLEQDSQAGQEIVPDSQPVELLNQNQLSASPNKGESSIECNSNAKVIEYGTVTKPDSSKKSYVVSFQDNSSNRPAEKFEEEWKKFTEFLVHENIPTKEDYTKYFDHLKRVKKSKGKKVGKVTQPFIYIFFFIFPRF